MLRYSLYTVIIGRVRTNQHKLNDLVNITKPEPYISMVTNNNIRLWTKAMSNSNP